ncbi:retrovirus-related pol polyprotein from transposon TNT 1-94 [Tanacetum coccineum]
MQEKLNQFISNDVWELVPNPKDMTIIGTKWVYRNKLDENGIVSRNKARIVAQEYNQQEGIDYDKTYAPVARLESIRILLAYACALYFKLFQMDVKSAFLNRFINEEVYVAQPPGFIDFAKPNHVYRLKKVLYGLKRALKAWYDRLKAFLIKNDYAMGMLEDAIFFNQSKYIKEMLKKFGLEDFKPMKTPMSTEMKLTKDEEVGQALIPPQSVNQTQLTQPLFPHLLINSYVASVLHAQSPPSPQGDNQIQPPPPSSPSREMLVDDINQLQDLLNLLAMHFSQRNTPSSPCSPNLSHTLNLNQVEHHVGYCPCCIFTKNQTLTLGEDLNWIEFLLTHPQPPLQVQRDYPPTTTSAPNSPPTTN